MASVNDHQTRITNLENRNFLNFKDTRHVNDKPDDFSMGMTLDFKAETVTGLNGYSGVATMRSWADFSGGVVHQVAYGDSGNVYHRFGTRSNTWNAWKKIWLQGDRITNAVWNDYAEYFPKGEETEPGDIIALDSNSNKEQYIKADCNSRRVIGVHSDSYGHILGGDKVEDYNKFFEENDKKYIPVGLNGRVYVKIKGPVKIGDYIVPSEEKGIGRALKNGEKSKNIIGYVVEPDNLTEERRVKIFIALGGG